MSEFQDPQDHRGRTLDLEPALIEGGAVVLDDNGRVRFGISDEAIEQLAPGRPELLRLAVAHLATRYAAEVGLPAPHRGGSGLGLAPERSRGTRGLINGSWVPAPVVLCALSYLDDELRSTALELRQQGSALVPVVAIGATRYVGPLLSPDEGPCIDCVRRSVWPNRQSAGLVPERPLSSEQAGGLRALARTVIEAHPHELAGQILEWDTEGFFEPHPVRRFADCMICGGEGSDPNERPPRLVSRAAHPIRDTGTRVTGPEQALHTYRHLVSPLTGAVRHVRRLDAGPADLIHVYSASHAVDLGARSLRDFMRDGRDQSGGKGSSAAQAQASALCEALERFSAVFRGGEVDACGPMRVVEGAIDPSDVMLFSDRQYASRGEWNAQLEGRFHEVPQPFDAADEVSWSRVWWLQSGEAAHVPTSLLYYGFRGPGSQYCNADSNGLAAGQTLEEAVLQGFFELVERDAVALWWYNRIAYPQVDVASFEDRYIDRVFSHYRQIGRECWVLDLTSDIEIPVFAALSARVGSGRPEVIFGFGADLDASIALRRCVTEMNQMLATVRRPLPERRAQLRGEFGDALRWWLQATLEDNAYILPSPALGSRSREYFLHDRSDDLLDDVQRCMAIADHHGLRVYVRDMTRADLGIAVVKMIVPGLRHFWRRLGPGRLYDVPVKLGKRSIPVAEPDMNPTSMFA